MKKRFPINAIELCHGSFLDPDYVIASMRKAANWGIRQVHITSSPPDNLPMKSEYADIGAFVTYRDFPGILDPADHEYTMKEREKLLAICQETRKLDIELFCWYKEIWFPAKMLQLYPELLSADKKLNLASPLLADFIDAKLSEFFTDFPEVKGLVLTMYEVMFLIYRDTINKGQNELERTCWLLNLIWQKCLQYNKVLIVRLFSGSAWENKLIRESCERVSRDIIIMAKVEKYDWHCFAPINDGLQSSTNPVVFEMDLQGQYFGDWATTICCFPDHVQKRINQALEINSDLIGGIGRPDFVYRQVYLRPHEKFDRSKTSSVIGSANEINLYAYARLMQNPELDLEIIWQDWVREHYQIQREKVVRNICEILADSFEIHKLLRYDNGQPFIFLPFFPGKKYFNNLYIVDLFREGKIINGGPKEWYMRKWEKAPGGEKIIGHKKEAIRLIKISLKKLAALQDEIPEVRYRELAVALNILSEAAPLYLALAYLFSAYQRSLETAHNSHQRQTAVTRYIDSFEERVHLLTEKYGKEWYNRTPEAALDFIIDFRQIFSYECRVFEKHNNDPRIIDFILPGSYGEGHSMRKSSIHDEKSSMLAGHTCRIIGMEHNEINYQGWCEYTLDTKNLKGKQQNYSLTVDWGAHDDKRDGKLIVAGQTFIISESGYFGFKTLKFSLPRVNDRYISIRLEKTHPLSPIIGEIRLAQKDMRLK